MIQLSSTPFNLALVVMSFLACACASTPGYTGAVACFLLASEHLNELKRVVPMLLAVTIVLDVTFLGLYSPGVFGM